MIGNDVVIRPFFYENDNMKIEESVSVPQWWFQKLLGILKAWLLGEVFEPKLSMFSENHFLLPQSTYYVIGIEANKARHFKGSFSEMGQFHTPVISEEKLI